MPKRYTEDASSCRVRIEVEVKVFFLFSLSTRFARAIAGNFFSSLRPVTLNSFDRQQRRLRLHFRFNRNFMFFANFLFSCLYAMFFLLLDT
jgi:hypothetical protein